MLTVPGILGMAAAVSALLTGCALPRQAPPSNDNTIIENLGSLDRRNDGAIVTVKGWLRTSYEGSIVCETPERQRCLDVIMVPEWETLLDSVRRKDREDKANDREPGDALVLIKGRFEWHDLDKIRRDYEAWSEATHTLSITGYLRHQRIRPLQPIVLVHP